MAKTIFASGTLSVLDLNDAIISGEAPSNPVVGTLWIDNTKDPSVLYAWNGSAWVEQHLSIESLDPDFKEDLDNELESLKDIVNKYANDGILSNGEKLNIKLLLVELTGQSISGNTLPTIDTILSNYGGQIGTALLEAQVAGVPAAHEAYTGFKQAYNNLKKYLESLTPRPWLSGDTTIEPKVWEQQWNSYYDALNSLQKATTEYLSNSLKPGDDYNGVKITGENGIIVLRKDEKVRTILNATEGISVERKLSNGAWEKVFYADTNGILNVKGLKISNDSYIGDKTASQVNNQVFNVIDGQITSLMDRTTVTVNGTSTSIKEAYNHLSSDVSGVKQTIGETIEEIDGLEKTTTERFTAVENTVSGLSSTVSSTTSKVTAVEGSLNTYKTETNSSIATIKTDVNGIKTTLSGVDAKIETAKGEAVSSSKSYTNTEISTVKGLIDQKVSQSDVDKTLAGLKLGGRNYLKNGNFTKGTDNEPFRYWTNWGTCTRSIVTVGNKKYVRLTATTTESYRGLNQAISAMVYPNEKVTVSFYAYAAANGQKMTVGYHQKLNNTIVTQNWQTFTLTTTPTRYTHTFTLTTSNIDNLNFMIGNSGTAFDIYITDIKHEKGDKATDWTPSYEEIDGDISDAYAYTDTQISHAEASFNQTASGIKTEVKKYADDLSNAQKGRNKWLVSRYSIEKITTASDLAHKHIGGLDPLETVEYTDQVSLTPFSSTNYIAHYYTNVFFGAATSKTFSYRSDDNSVIYINGKEVIRKPYSASAENITLDFPSGWSTLEVLQYQGTGGQVIYFSPAISSSVEAMAYNIAPKAASAITQLSNSINLKVEADGVISAINMDESGVQIQGKYVDIQGLVSFEALDKNMSSMFTRPEGDDKTYINGAHIQTGTIKADKLNAYGLTIHDSNETPTFTISREGDVKISGEIVSIDYSEVPGSEAGYKLTKEGDAYFNNAILRGDVRTPFAGISNLGAKENPNLLPHSDFKDDVASHYKLYSTNSGWKYVFQDGYCRVYTTDVATAQGSNGILTPVLTESLKNGQTYTLSFEAMSNSNMGTLDYVYLITNDGTNINLGSFAINNYDAGFGRVSKTITLSKDVATPQILIGFKDAVVTGNTNTKGFRVRKIKFEKGSNVTDYIPSEANRTVRFWAGSAYEERDNAPFIVYQDGTLRATRGNFGGTFTGSIDIGNIHISDTNTTNASFKINTNNDAKTVIHMTDSLASFNCDTKFGSGLTFKSSDNSLSFTGKSVFQSKYADVTLNGNTAALELLGEYGGHHTIGYAQNYGGLLFHSRGGSAGGYDFKFSKTSGSAVVHIDGEVSKVKKLTMEDSNKIELVSIATSGNSGIDFMIR